MLSSVIGKFHWEEEDEKSTEYMKFTEIFKIKFEKKKIRRGCKQYGKC